MMAIKAAIAAKGEGETRNTVLVPESAHGTNPASAAGAGFRVHPVPARDDGTLDPAEVNRRLGADVAAIMLTNPNTCGLFEKDAAEIAALVHEAGAYFYCDGANFNAIMGKARPGDLGADAMHINLHKTFSTPHGGGGPGAGPVVLSSRLAPFAPVPFLRQGDGDFCLVEQNLMQAKPVAEWSGHEILEACANIIRIQHGILSGLPQAIGAMRQHIGQSAHEHPHLAMEGRDPAKCAGRLANMLDETKAALLPAQERHRSERRKPR